MNEPLTCSLCGYEFSAEELKQGACQACPINNGCNLVCCPACGHTDINPGQSRLVQWAAQFFGGKRIEPSFPER